MRKLTVAAFVSVDGVMQAPGGSDEDRDGGFSLGGWVGPHADAAFGEVMTETFSDPYDLLLGRRTYDIFASYWPRFEGKDALADAFGDANKYVATRNPDFEAGWRNSHVLKGDVVEAIRRVKAEPGRNLLTQHGQGSLGLDRLGGRRVDHEPFECIPISDHAFGE